jgi:hypothetical protein
MRQSVLNWAVPIMVLGSPLLSGCQSMVRPTAVPAAMRASAPAQKPTGWVDVQCSGGLRCRFDRVDAAAMTAQSDPSAHQAARFFVLHLPAGLHQLQTSFYPVTLDRAEQFVLIHHFKAGHQYNLHLFRDRHVHASSVLNMAAPDPLCIEVLENQQQIRRFCRPFDPQTGLGEFIEQAVSP